MIDVPAAVRAGSVAEGILSIPTRRSSAGLQADGSVARLQVGGIILLANQPRVAFPSEQSSGIWSSWRSSASSSPAIYFGPTDVALGGLAVFGLETRGGSSNTTVDIFAGANRGRGQIFPDGSASNVSGVPSVTHSYVTSIIHQARREGLAVISIGQGKIHCVHVPTGQAVGDGIQLRCPVQSGPVGQFLNLGGFGQGDVGIAIIQSGSCETTSTILCVTQVTQALLLLKKRQYELLNL